MAFGKKKNNAAEDKPSIFEQYAFKKQVKKKMTAIDAQKNWETKFVYASSNSSGLNAASALNSQTLNNAMTQLYSNVSSTTNGSTPYKISEVEKRYMKYVEPGSIYEEYGKSKAPSQKNLPLKWECEVCHRERDDSDISVHTYALPGGYGERNIKFCNDTIACFNGAKDMERDEPVPPKNSVEDNPEIASLKRKLLALGMDPKQLDQYLD